MKNKSVSFSINTKDIRPLAANALTNILTRYNRNQTKSTKEISTALTKGTAEEVLKALKKLLEHNRQLIDEINQLSGLFLEIEPLPADTEVLKDLPDLEEDSLGVNGGGE